MQGFASALIPVGISIMRDELPKEKMGSAVALMSATLGIGSALGLPLAGSPVRKPGLGNRSSGCLRARARCCSLPWCWWFRSPGCGRRAGSTTSGRWCSLRRLAALLLAISKGGSWGWGSEPVLLLFLAAALLLAVWVPYELKVGQPMVDLRTSARRPVLLTNLASLLIGFAMFANMLLTTQQLQLPTSTGYGFQLSVITAGLCMVPSGLAMVVFAPVSGGIIKRFGGRPALIAGAAVMIAGYVGRVFFWDSIAWVIIGSTVVSIGTAIAYAAMPTLIMGAVPITETASANGLNSLVRSIGTSTSSAAVAAVLTSVTITVGTAQLPSFQAFQDVFWMATLASAASIMAAVFIPAARGRPAGSDPARQSRANSWCRAASCRHDHRPLTPAVVTVLQTTGEPVDWSRVDSEGNYSVALPGAGKYLMVANTAGWAPMAEVFDFDGRTLGQNFHLHDRLQLGGVARAAGTPLEGAVVTLLQATGEHVATTRTEDDGTYSLPLPAPGRYILTMLHPVTHQAMARKLAVDNRSVTADLELDTPTEQLVDA